VKRLALAAGLVTVVAVRHASAQAPIEDVRIVYRAPDACPSEAWALRRIEGRTDRFRRVTGDASVRTFTIDITEAGPRFAGILSITEPGPPARTTSRRIEAPLCAEVADGLALIAALTIDPRAKLEAPPEEPPPEAPAEPKPPPSQPTPPPAKPPPAKPQPLARAPERARPYLRLGAGFAAVSGIAPDALYGGQWLVEGGLGNKAWFSPALRLTARHVRRDGLDFDQGTAHFRHTAAALDVCPLRAPIETLELRPCLTAELGSLSAEGTNNDRPESHHRAWAALGALARIGLDFPGIGLELGFGAEAPLRRDRFRFDTQIGEVKAVVLVFGLAITGKID
jgi:hypothetical protein